jgi:hypothetical protein
MLDLLTLYFLIVQRVIFELCQRTQQPSLTVHPVDGSMFGLWPLFHLRDGGKWTKITATQHGGTLRYWFLHYTTLKIMLFSFSLIDFFFYFNVVFLSFWLSLAIYRLQVATFSPLAWVAIAIRFAANCTPICRGNRLRADCSFRAGVTRSI